MKTKLIYIVSIILSFGFILNASTSVFDNAVQPISNPVYHELATVQSNVHGIFMHQELPSHVDITGGGQLPVGGDFQVYAVQVEYALNDKLSLVAGKDGYIDFNPDSTFTSDEGFADVAAGLKYLFKKDEATGFAASARLLIELPIGSDEVWQGNGSGNAAPGITVLKMKDEFQYSATAGLIVPFDGDDESTLMYDSFHISYHAWDKVVPLIELNHFRTLNSGNGSKQFDNQAGGAVPSLAAFEGGDLINLGAANAEEHEDFVTAAVGLRFKATPTIDAGIAYEVPITDKSSSLMESRLSIDMVWKF